jgi:diguanylate cyclase (GGDEF)-like protein
MNKPLRVLIVEDSEDDAELLILELKNNDLPIVYQRVDTKETMAQALDSPNNWDLILADYSMPQFSAIEALKLLKEKALDLPFIIVSGKIGEDTAVAAMKAGAHDYLLKGKLARLIPAIERELREAAVRLAHKQAQERLRYLAFYDDLTGLPNRTLFLDHLKQSIETNDSLFGVLLLSLARFRIIKYSLGHALADRLLIAVGKLLESCLEEGEIVARTNADEFAILVKNLPEPEAAKKRAQIIYDLLTNPFKLNGPIVFSHATIGVVSSHIGYEQPELYLQAADTAMHYAKVALRSNIAFFAPSMQTRAVERFQLESDLQQAIELQTLHLNYQPIVALANGQIAGFEALVRWRHPSYGLVSPNNFIPLSEETGLVVPLGQWVLAEACQKLINWQARFPQHRPLTINVNLSGIQLANPDLLSQIDEVLESLSLKGDSLKLEITETVLMENASAVTKILEKLKERQIKLCIDDFGTGYSSLSYLHYLPIDTLKIDRSFLNQDPETKSLDIVRAIVNMAHSLGLEVVAEGMETEEQLLMLKNLGCEYGQGYFFSGPLDDRGVVSLMENSSCG